MTSHTSNDLHSFWKNYHQLPSSVTRGVFHIGKGKRGRLNSTVPEH